MKPPIAGQKKGPSGPPRPPSGPPGSAPKPPSGPPSGPPGSAKGHKRMSSTSSNASSNASSKSTSKSKKKSRRSSLKLSPGDLNRVEEKSSSKSSSKRTSLPPSPADANKKLTKKLTRRMSMKNNVNGPPVGKGPSGPPPKGPPLGKGPPGKGPPKMAPPGRGGPPKMATPGKGPPKMAPPGRGGPPKMAPPGKGPPKMAPPGSAGSKSSGPPRMAPPGSARAPPSKPPPGARGKPITSGRGPPRMPPPGARGNSTRPPTMAPPGSARGPPGSARGPPGASLGATLNNRKSMGADANGPPSMAPPGGSSTMDERMAFSAPPATSMLNEPVDLTNLSKDPMVLREQLRQLEQDVTTLSTAPKGDTKEEIKEQDIVNKGMTRDDKRLDRTLRDELATTSRELANLQRDSISDSLRQQGIPPSMEAYEQKYREAKDLAIEAEKDKLRALEALQSLVGGASKLKEIVTAAKLEASKNNPEAAALRKQNSLPKRMSIDDYQPKHDGINLSGARPSLSSTSPSRSNSRPTSAMQHGNGPPMTPMQLHGAPGQKPTMDSLYFENLNNAGKTGNTNNTNSMNAMDVVRRKERTVAETTLEYPLGPGATQIPMVDAEGKGFQIGQTVIIGTGENAEERIIVGFGSLILNLPLEKSHAKGESIVGLDNKKNMLSTKGPGQESKQPTNPWDDDSLILATQNSDMPDVKPPPPSHAITDEIDDDVPPPPPPEDPFWQKRMDADRVRDRERMRKWKSIQSKPADHKRDWNQSRAVDVPLTRQRHQRGGYGRRQKYRDQHRNRVRRVVEEDDLRSSRRNGSTSNSSSPRNASRSPRNHRDDYDMNGRRDRKRDSGFLLNNGKKVSYDSSEDTDDSSRDDSLLTSSRIRNRSDMYDDLKDSRERHHEARRKQREIKAWARQLNAVSGSGNDQHNELQDILREAQGDDDSLYDSDEDSMHGGSQALLLDQRVHDMPSSSPTANARGRRTKTLPSGRVVKDLRSPTQYGNYAKASRYGATGRKYRSRMDSYHRASSYEYQRDAGNTRVEDRVLASRNERNVTKQTQNDRREAAKLMREREEALEAREGRQKKRGGGSGRRKKKK